MCLHFFLEAFTYDGKCCASVNFCGKVSFIDFECNMDRLGSLNVSRGVIHGIFSSGVGVIASSELVCMLLLSILLLLFTVTFPGVANLCDVASFATVVAVFIFEAAPHWRMLSSTAETSIALLP